MEFLKGRKLKQSEKILIILVIVAAVAALFYFFIYHAQVEKMAVIRMQIEENNKILSELKGFEGQLKAVEKEVDKLDEEIYDETKEWFPSLRQDVIIKDLENKIRSTNIDEGTASFVSSKVANIAEFKEEEKPPTIAEALTLSFVTLMQDEQVEGSAEDEQLTIGGIIDKVSDTLAIATPTPGPDNDEQTTAFGAQAGAGTGKQRTGDNKDLDPEVQAKLDALNKNLSNLTEKELVKQIQEILASTDAKVEKMQIAVNFSNSSYKSIMDFINKIENTSPHIYVSSLSFSDSTNAYIGLLQREAEAIEEQRVAALNLFREPVGLTAIEPNEIQIKYNGDKKYNGSIRLDYFAVSKIHK